MLLKKQINPIRYFQSNGTRILIVGLLGFFALAGFCYAISYGGLGIYPNKSEWDEKNSLTKSWFIYTLEPGEVKEGKVDIINTSDESVGVRAYPVDAVTTKDGAFAPQSEDREKINVGAWVVLAESEVSLEPKETKTIKFTIKVPENAEVGDHMGAIIIQSKELPGAVEVTGLRIATRVGARMYITIPGDMVRELEFTEFTWKTIKGKITFYLTFVNKGNVRISPKGNIEIKNIFGKAAGKTEITQREVFPKNTIILPIELKEALGIGKFSALASVSYDANKTLSKKISFWVLPSQGIIIAIGIVLILLVIVGFLIIRKIKRKI